MLAVNNKRLQKTSVEGLCLSRFSAVPTLNCAENDFSKMLVFFFFWMCTLNSKSTLASSIFLHCVIQGFFELHQQGTLLLPKLLFALLSPSFAAPLHMPLLRVSREIRQPGLGAVVDQERAAHRSRAYRGNMLKLCPRLASICQ